MNYFAESLKQIRLAVERKKPSELSKKGEERADCRGGNNRSEAGHKNRNNSREVSRR